MKVSNFIDFKKKYKPVVFRRHVIELYRLELVSQSQILAELNISLNSLRVWNRDYQRYRFRRYYPKSNYLRKMKTEADEITRLKQEKLKREAFETMISIAEKDGVARAIQNSNPKKVWPRWRTTPNGNGT